MRPLALSSLLLPALSTFARAAKTTVWATPHDSYSSSVGVLGCKINTDRVAYWPASISCNNICVSLSYEGRSVYLLRIDQSGGAYDVSYDAWNYLYTGYGATDKPTAGGAIAMETEDVDPSKCKDLIKTKDGKLPLSAANSMNFVASCLGEGSGESKTETWVGKNYRLWNIMDSVCSWGHDEECELDWPTANQAKCPNQLGNPVTLTSAPVYNIRYPSGEKVVAGTGQVVDAKQGGSGRRIGVDWLTTGVVVAAASLVSMLGGSS